MHEITKRNREATIRKISCLRECSNCKKNPYRRWGEHSGKVKKTVAELKTPKNHKIVCEFRLWVTPPDVKVAGDGQRILYLSYSGGFCTNTVFVIKGDLLVHTISSPVFNGPDVFGVS